MFEMMKKQILAERTTSAWTRGVKLYALELVDNMIERIGDDGDLPSNLREFHALALNGASDWQEYSEGGCALIYNREIAERLCTESELERTDHGMKSPNAIESWIDVQTRALHQAWRIVRDAYFDAR